MRAQAVAQKHFATLDPLCQALSFTLWLRSGFVRLVSMCNVQWVLDRSLLSFVFALQCMDSTNDVLYCFLNIKLLSCCDYNLCLNAGLTLGLAHAAPCSFILSLPSDPQYRIALSRVFCSLLSVWIPWRMHNMHLQFSFSPVAFTVWVWTSLLLTRKSFIFY